MITDEEYPIDGRVVHILADDGADLGSIAALKDALVAAGAAPQVVATHKGAITGPAGEQIMVDKSFHTASAAEPDAFVVAHGADLAADPGAIVYIQTGYRHHKTIAAWGDGRELLSAAGVELDRPGIVDAEEAAPAFADAVVAAMAKHRHWERLAPHPTRGTTGA